MDGTVAASPAADAHGGRIWILVILLLAGLGFRWLWFPSGFEQRNSDEPAYLYDSLLLFEGIIPGHKSVPSGMMTWVEWSYIAGQSAWNFAHQTAIEKQVIPVARPLYVLNRTLFDDYRDISALRRYLLVWNIVFGLVSVAAAWKFGEWAAGESGALLCGGMLALLPILHDVGGTARPLAIAIGLVLLCFAALSRQHFRCAAICFGLAVGTRFEMLQLLPLVLAMVIAEMGWRASFRILLKSAGVAIIAFILISPWWPITWFGNLRSVVGVRLMSVSQHVPHLTLLKEFVWSDAMLLPALLLIASVAQVWRRKRGWMIPAAGLLVAATMFIGHNNISYQTPPIVATVLVGAMGLAVLPERWKPTVNILIIATLVLAASQSIYQSRVAEWTNLSADTTAWVEHHVPPGTRVYWPAVLSLEPLPTPAAGTEMWNEVMDDTSWRTKMGWALGYGDKGAEHPDIPRATSEDILYKERANVRLWFILAGRPEVPLPRFDVRQVSGSTFFGVLDSVASFKKTGGVLVLLDPPDPSLGPPTMSWKNRATRDVSIFVSPDVKLNQ